MLTYGLLHNTVGFIFDNIKNSPKSIKCSNAILCLSIDCLPKIGLNLIRGNDVQTNISIPSPFDIFGPVVSKHVF